MLARQYEEALAFDSEILRFDPSFYKAYTGMGRTYAQMGRYPESIGALQKGLEMAGEVPNILSAMGQVYALNRDVERAHSVLARLERLSRERNVSCACFAIVHMGLGDLEECFQWLEMGCDRREASLAGLKSHPLYEPLHGHSRYDALLRRMRLG
jgi:serine/threonine-protein kinase